MVYFLAETLNFFVNYDKIMLVIIVNLPKLD